ncbi:MAG: CCA tRNA nucleotidyltransferase, partial [Candidatus Hydrogenedens sp.]
KKGYIAYFAGGCVRDLVMKREPVDYDIATNAIPKEVHCHFPDSIMLWKHYGVVRVLLPEGEYEVTTFRSDGPYLDGRHPSSVVFSSPQEDAQRRDFTINALFFDPSTNEIIDYVGGQEDIRKGIIRTVGNPHHRFAEDYLRLLRSARFSARFNFKIERDTLEAMKELRAGIQKVPAERIRDELIKILTEGNPYRAFEILDRTGLLEEILPEISALKGIEQDKEYHPEGDVFIHTLQTLKYLNNPSPKLALAILLHDVGKKQTITYTDRIRFPKHEAIGAQIATNIMERLRFSRSEIEDVAWLIRNHMTLLQYPQMRESTRKRLFKNPLFPLLLELVSIDIQASFGELSSINSIKKDYQMFQQTVSEYQPLLRGKDLIGLGFSPGPLFRTILDEVENAQLEGTIKTHEEAIQFVLQHWQPS